MACKPNLWWMGIHLKLLPENSSFNPRVKISNSSRHLGLFAKKKNPLLFPRAGCEKTD
jgi:hypothetical protein